MGTRGAALSGPDGRRATEMMNGRWRDRFPRVVLALPGLNGPLDIEFIVDTGFDGELALSDSLIQRLDIAVLDSRFVQLAGGFRQRTYAYELRMEWDEETRLIEVLSLDGNSLIGNGLWKGQLLQAENNHGGEVAFEPL